jgi:hypothetical protein
MKSTGMLTSMGDSGLGRHIIVLHPNDGYDLGLLAMHNKVEIVSGQCMDDFTDGAGKGVHGTLLLKNECTPATVRMNLALWSDIGKPRRVALSFEKDRLFICIS